MAHLPIPDPYDFELSTGRFRAFGPDVANLWHEGGLHRVVGGREVRIVAAERKGVLRVPIGATFRHDGAWAAYVVREGVARLVPLTVGARSEAEVAALIRRRVRSRNGLAALAQVRRRVHRIEFAELLDIVQIWVDSALRLNPRDLKLMQRLVSRQNGLNDSHQIH